MYTSHQNITYLHYVQGPFHKYHYEGWPPWLATMVGHHVNAAGAYSELEMPSGDAGYVT